MRQYSKHGQIEEYLYGYSYVSDLIDSYDCLCEYDVEGKVYDIWFNNQDDCDDFNHKMWNFISQLEDKDESYLEQHWLYK